MLLFPWPPFRKVCPNYYVVMFQPRTWTSPYLGSISNCYVDMLLIPTPSTSRCPPVGATHSCPFSLSVSDCLVPTQDHPSAQTSSVSVPAFQVPSIPDSYSATSSYPLTLPHLPDSRCYALSSAKIYSNVSPSCFWDAAFRHHGSRRLPPPL